MTLTITEIELRREIERLRKDNETFLKKITEQQKTIECLTDKIDKLQKEK